MYAKTSSVNGRELKLLFLFLDGLYTQELCSGCFYIPILFFITEKTLSTLLIW